MNIVSRPHWLTSSAIKKLFQAIPESSKNLRFVGGCVRDHLLGIESQDIDLATSYKPQEIIDFLKKADLKFVPTGLEYGTVMAVIEGKGYEITTLRHDIETDGRHATVSFTDSWQDDAARRDFKFNALYMDINGDITDFWDGQSDLAAGHVRFIGTPSKRIQEDYLRILRFFRFYARFANKEPDAETLKAIQDNAKGLENISGERIQTEFLKLLDTKAPLPSLRLMQETNVFQHILPINAPLDTKDLEHLLETNIKTSALTRFLALLGEKEELLKDVSKNLKLSRKQSTWMSSINALSLSFEAEPLEIYLHFQGQEKALAAYALMLARKREQANMSVLEVIQNWTHTPFPITGQDLIKQGFTPGPSLGKKLKKQEHDWVLNGRPDL